MQAIFLYFRLISVRGNNEYPLIIVWINEDIGIIPTLLQVIHLLGFAW